MARVLENLILKMLFFPISFARTLPCCSSVWWFAGVSTMLKVLRWKAVMFWLCLARLRRRDIIIYFSAKSHGVQRLRFPNFIHLALKWVGNTYLRLPIMAVRCEWNLLFRVVPHALLLNENDCEMCHQKLTRPAPTNMLLLTDHACAVSNHHLPVIGVQIVFTENIKLVPHARFTLHTSPVIDLTLTIGQCAVCTMHSSTMFR